MDQFEEIWDEEMEYEYIDKLHQGEKNPNLWVWIVAVGIFGYLWLRFF